MRACLKYDIIGLPLQYNYSNPRHNGIEESDYYKSETEIKRVFLERCPNLQDVQVFCTTRRSVIATSLMRLWLVGEPQRATATCRIVFNRHTFTGTHPNYILLYRCILPMPVDSNFQLS